MDRGVLVDTLETATTWAGLGDLHRGVGAALRGALARRGTPAAVMCHVSHLYPTGASLHFTYLARRQAGAEIEQWQAAKATASDAIARAGGRDDHPLPRGRHRPRAVARGRARPRGAAGGEGEGRPRGRHEPGKLLG
jgi:alkyldihydroxyacetonephosphate synthase